MVVVLSVGPTTTTVPWPTRLVGDLAGLPDQHVNIDVIDHGNLHARRSGGTAAVAAT